MSSSEDRRIRRYLIHKSRYGKLRKGSSENTYADNKGHEYSYAWVARTASFFNVLNGCFKNGFPIAVGNLWYAAWAFYPFFFMRRNLGVKNPVPVLNHERIHIRQQRDIHLTVSLPLVVLCLFAEVFGWFNPIYLLCTVPFIPTIIYGIEMLRSWWNLHWHNVELRSKNWAWSSITFNRVRENTCFEREAISRATNADYLFTRKFWAVLAYTGWKCFQNYGIK